MEGKALIAGIRGTGVNPQQTTLCPRKARFAQVSQLNVHIKARKAMRVKASSSDGFGWWFTWFGQHSGNEEQGQNESEKGENESPLEAYLSWLLNRVDGTDGMLKSTSSRSTRVGHSGQKSSHGSTASVFGVLHNPKLPTSLADAVSVYDARDAIEACGGLWGEDKHECYSVFGVNENADMWFDVVYKLESALERETDPEEEACHDGMERC